MVIIFATTFARLSSFFVMALMLFLILFISMARMLTFVVLLFGMLFFRDFSHHLRTETIDGCLILLKDHNNLFPHDVEILDHVSIAYSQIVPSLLIVHVIKEIIDIVNLLNDSFELFDKDLELRINLHKSMLPYNGSRSHDRIILHMNDLIVDDWPIRVNNLLLMLSCL